MKHTVFIISILFALVFLFAQALPSSAQAPCTTLYGGGVKTDGSSYCMETIIAMQETPQAIDARSLDTTWTNTSDTPSQTKGGLPIQSMPSITKQPNTGPESLALLGMGPLAAIGWYLRRKTA